MTKSNVLHADSTENGITSNTPVCVESANFRTTNLWSTVVQHVFVTDLSVHQVTPIMLMGLSNVEGMPEFHAECHHA